MNGYGALILNRECKLSVKSVDEKDDDDNTIHSLYLKHQRFIFTSFKGVQPKTESIKYTTKAFIKKFTEKEYLNLRITTEKINQLEIIVIIQDCHNP